MHCIVEKGETPSYVPLVEDPSKELLGNYINRERRGEFYNVCLFHQLN